MHIEKRIKAFVQLGAYLSSQSDPALLKVVNNAYRHNNWFTIENIQAAIKAIAENLMQDKINQWISKYAIKENHVSKKVAIIMAGNIPLVGFHDLLSVLISGNIAVVKMSPKDNILLPHITNMLVKLEPAFQSYIEYSDKLKHADAFIATGSNNSLRSFEYYFDKYPHIFRKNKTSVAIIDNKTTAKDIQALGIDVFQYFGLGCRNVSKLYVPQKYDLNIVLENFNSYKDIIQHNKYKNNYDYNLSLLIMNKISYLTNDFLILIESKNLFSLIGTLYYEYYDSEKEIQQKIEQEKDNIQCVASNNTSLKHVSYGQAQSPELWDYPDGVDILDFLTKL